MEFLRFAWTNLGLFLAIAIPSWIVFISNIVRNAIGVAPASFEEQAWAGGFVIAAFLAMLIDVVVRYRKLNK
jgi:hypothetical protein